MDLLAKERHMRILDLLKQNGAITTGELTDALQVSLETVRRDLLAMEKTGQLQRVHGGAVPIGSMQPYPELPQRLEAHPSEKTELCSTAAMLVDEGDIIFIDCGSTAVFFAQALLSRGIRLTVVTHSMSVFTLLSHEQNIKVILCGGFYDPSEKAFYGQLALDALKKIHVQKAFLCPSGISLKGGVWDYNQALIQMQSLAIASADRVFFLADSDKFEKCAMLKLCDISPRHTFVTDSEFPSHYRQFYQEHGITVITSLEDF